MSRIGKKPITLPAKVTATINGTDVTVKGPKGEMTLPLPPDMTVKQEGNELIVERPSDSRNHRALHGLTRALLANNVNGVSNGFRRTLKVEGVGYNGDVRGKDLVMKVGYSHEVVINPPPGITFSTEDKGTTIHIDGTDKQLIGQVAANIRELRPPEPYLGKGVRYSDEVIRRKAGKAGKAK
ncbi:MAG: 50S ribosomal protein L6 [Anaerolineaceae bacterium]|nr:50S ribosomal protein L6 [Anaerolineaceae bacterium]